MVDGQQLRTDRNGDPAQDRPRAALRDEKRERLSEKKAIALRLAQLSMIKRPVLIAGERLASSGSNMARFSARD